MEGQKRNNEKQPCETIGSQLREDDKSNDFAYDEHYYNQQSESPPLNEFNEYANRLDENRIVKHIMVIGFHHKHGYQVDYCYPPLTPGGPMFSTPNNLITLPPSWKTLPLLCLPDGSHNYDSDTIYFTMPDAGQESNTCEPNSRQQSSENDREEPESTYNNTTTNNNATKSKGIKTIFGTACYRQIHVDKLLNRTDDMTRMSVQKSVCVLSTQPLFGLIRSKLEMITHAYFEELDFSKVRILKLTYDNLNSLLSRDSVRENATFLGLSARHLVSYFGCNMLVLFKAMLLEKKILFYKSPVRDLCSTIMSMCSLFPSLLECGGLDYSTCDLQLSPNLLEVLKLLPKPNEENCDLDKAKEQQLHSKEGKVFFSPSKEEVVIIKDLDSSCDDKKVLKGADDLMEPANAHDNDKSQKKLSTANINQLVNRSTDELEQTGEYEVINHTLMDSDEQMDVHQEETSSDITIIDDPYMYKLCQLKPEDTGLPLQIFTRGSFCLPYLSISYLDLLSDTRVRSFVIGATNFLFKQRREMYDVIVDMEENSIMISDVLLKKCLSLTIEDLRFIDYLNRHVKLEGNTKDEFDPINHDVTKWIGGDEWIRYHFRIYTLYLLKAAKTQTNLDSFNSSFVQAWKQTTNNYRIWEAAGKSAVLDKLQSRHPFSSSAKGINFSDMKLKLSYAVNSSERGRMVNQTLNGIGKWSIWNNLATAGNLAATTVSTLANSAAAQTSSIVAAATTTGDKQPTSNSKAQDI